MKNSSACKDYLIEAMKYHLLPTEQRMLMKSVRTRLRTPMNLPKVGPTVHSCACPTEAHSARFLCLTISVSVSCGFSFPAGEMSLGMHHRMCGSVSVDFMLRIDVFKSFDFFF